jgi:hypothetical protein
MTPKHNYHNWPASFFMANCKLTKPEPVPFQYIESSQNMFVTVTVIQVAKLKRVAEVVVFCG